MKQSMLIVAMLALTAPAYAQFGGLSDGLKRAQQAKAAKDKFDDLNVTDEEERKIGEDVSLKIRDRFGVVQDPAIHKYVTLVGTLLARQSERPNLAWTFIVLDTDGVNAFASPGGIIHITRGALGLIQNIRMLWLAWMHGLDVVQPTAEGGPGDSDDVHPLGPARDVVEQRGLPDPRLADEQEDTAAAQPGPRDERVEGSPFGLPPHEHLPSLGTGATPWGPPLAAGPHD